ncbi:MAG: NAD(+) diphosphatase, partial [Bacteroidia bacterium]|nr:NAD(+) diphosphatase [Bacteroidia bacterium]
LIFILCYVMAQKSDEVRKCPECRQEFYPNLAPAIIVRVQKEDKILMVRARNFRGNFYGLVAGFVEPGETLEQCVEREVMEETGLRITNIRYFGSQPWPYPSGVMIGFTADYVGGELKLQQEELAAGDFFTRDQMPTLPKKLSIARKLVDDWLESKKM